MQLKRGINIYLFASNYILMSWVDMEKNISQCELNKEKMGVNRQIIEI